MILKRDSFVDDSHLLDKEMSIGRDDYENTYQRYIEEGRYLADVHGVFPIEEINRILLSFTVEHENKEYQLAHSFSLEDELEDFVALMATFNIKIELPISLLDDLLELICQKVIIETENITHNKKTYSKIKRLEPIDVKNRFRKDYYRLKRKFLS